jgi:hypothetical protein
MSPAGAATTVALTNFLAGHGHLLSMSPRNECGGTRDTIYEMSRWMNYRVAINSIGACYFSVESAVGAALHLYDGFTAPGALRDN